MGGCFSKPKPAEVKVEVVLPEKEREKEELSPNGKASPLAYKTNGTTRHYHHEERPIVLNPYTNPKDVVEASVCHVKDLENGQMREVDMGCGKALLIKQNGEYYAMGHKCPHYGAPLVKGVLSKGRVRCPWHGACFNIATGDIEDFPGLDGLPKFQVKIEKERVYIRASKQALQSQRRTKVMAKCLALSNYSTAITNILIIGAGPAGLVCAETLRQEGFSDRIVMCTSEKYLPYDRSKLSKSMDSQADQILLRSKEFFHTYDIEVLTETQVISVDTKNKMVVFKDGFRMEYNKLLIATGSTRAGKAIQRKSFRNLITVIHENTWLRLIREVYLTCFQHTELLGAGWSDMLITRLSKAETPSKTVGQLQRVGISVGLSQRVSPGLVQMRGSSDARTSLRSGAADREDPARSSRQFMTMSGRVVVAEWNALGSALPSEPEELRQERWTVPVLEEVSQKKYVAEETPLVLAVDELVVLCGALIWGEGLPEAHFWVEGLRSMKASPNNLPCASDPNSLASNWSALVNVSFAKYMIGLRSHRCEVIRQLDVVQERVVGGVAFARSNVKTIMQMKP
ncbi:apoptosis-inducing factor 3 isoform X1, partial [Pelobates cultripes]